MENFIIDLLIIISTTDGTYIEQYMNGSYASVKACQNDAKLLNESVKNHSDRLSFDVKFDCQVFKYETDK